MGNSHMAHAKAGAHCLQRFACISARLQPCRELGASEHYKVQGSNCQRNITANVSPLIVPSFSILARVLGAMPMRSAAPRMLSS